MVFVDRKPAFRVDLSKNHPSPSQFSQSLRHGGGDAPHPNSTPDALYTLGPQTPHENEGFNP